MLRTTYNDDVNLQKLRSMKL